ncbi:MAG: phosphotransferase family protein, partial [Actinomycetota bacterium]
MRGAGALPLEDLEDYLASQLGGQVDRLSATEFAGGASNPTYLLESDHWRAVLRSKPLGELISGAHAIDREFRVINALGETGFPVPEAILYCDDVEVIGAEFYLMEYVEGRVLEDFTIPGARPEERAAVYDSMNETMAQLHGIDPDAVGLSDFGRPGNYFERQIDLWMRQYHRQTRSVPRFEDLAGWLTANMIGDEASAVVHGDFRLANIVIAPEADEVATVLDWELSTIGHPLADFAYNLSQWYLPNLDIAFGKVTLADADLDELGIPSMKTYVDAYAARVGASISPGDLSYCICSR